MIENTRGLGSEENSWGVMLGTQARSGWSGWRVSSPPMGASGFVLFALGVKMGSFGKFVSGSSGLESCSAVVVAAALGVGGVGHGRDLLL